MGESGRVSVGVFVGVAESVDAAVGAGVSVRVGVSLGMFVDVDVGVSVRVGVLSSWAATIREPLIPVLERTYRDNIQIAKSLINDCLYPIFNKLPSTTQSLSLNYNYQDLNPFLWQRQILGVHNQVSSPTAIKKIIRTEQGLAVLGAAFRQ